MYPIQAYSDAWTPQKLNKQDMQKASSEIVFEPVLLSAIIPSKVG